MPAGFRWDLRGFRLNFEDFGEIFAHAVTQRVFPFIAEKQYFARSENFQM